LSEQASHFHRLFKNFFKGIELMASTQAAVQTESEALFELGKLYYERCDFHLAIEKFKAAADQYFRARDFDRFLKCQNYLLRMYSEREEIALIHSTKEKLQDLVLKEGFELNAKTYYTLGACASNKGQHELALEYFQKSLALALALDDKADICYAVSGIAVTYYHLDRLQDALKEIYNLQVFFQVIALPEVKLSYMMLNAHILRKMKRFDEAIEILWQCYELVGKSKNLYAYFSLLYGMGLAYRDAGELESARMYLQLAKRSIDAENLRNTYLRIESALDELGGSSHDDYDLVLESGSTSVTERKKGQIDFRNQFILLDMLRLFMRQPGQVQTKESLVKQIWKQDYNPAVHDNKIYVTIKRLRKMIEPDYEKPKYIFRAKNGYYLNKNTRVRVEH